MSYICIRFRYYFLAIGVWCSAVSSATAVDRYWSSLAGGDFHDSSNWATGVLPVSDGSDCAVFAISSTYDVQFDNLTPMYFLGQTRVNDLDVNAGKVSLVTTQTSRKSLRVDGNGGTQTIEIDGGTLNVGDPTSAARSFELEAGQAGIEVHSGILNVYQGSLAVAPISSGASGVINVAATGGTGALLVSGSGAEASADFNLFYPSSNLWGRAGGTANITFTDNGAGSFGPIVIAGGTDPNTTVVMEVSNGAELETGTLELAADGGMNTSTLLTVETGEASLTQIGSASLTVGHDSLGTAEIVVEDTGNFTTGTGTTIVNSTGSINVDDGGSWYANGNIVLDGGTFNLHFLSSFQLGAGLLLTAQNGGQFIYSGTYDINGGKTFNVNSGGTMSFTNWLDIGDSDGDGTLNVDGTTSKATVISPFASCWGDAGNTATVTLTNRGVVEIPDLELARSATAGTTANVQVQSSARLTLNGKLEMATAGGNSTSATLLVTNIGSLVEQDSAADNILGHATSGTAKIFIRNHGSLRFGTGTTTVNPTATIELKTGGVLTAPGPIIMNGGTFDFLGGTLHASTFDGDLVNQGGILAPGTSAGYTSIDGNYSQDPNSTLEIEVGGITPIVEHDQVSVTGNVILDGELELSIIDGFRPDPTDTFTVLNSNNLFSSFDNVLTGQRLPTLDGIGSFLVHYGVGSAYASNQIWLTDFVKTYSADFDFDGDVDGDDLAFWKGNFGLDDDADADGDGDSDGTDFLAWQRQTAGDHNFLSNTVAVPEPASVALILAGLLTIHPLKRW